MRAFDVFVVVGEYVRYNKHSADIPGRSNTLSPLWRCCNTNVTRWRHDMDTFSTLLALCEGDPLITGHQNTLSCDMKHVHKRQMATYHKKAIEVLYWYCILMNKIKWQYPWTKGIACTANRLVATVRHREHDYTSHSHICPWLFLLKYRFRLFETRYFWFCKHSSSGIFLPLTLRILN